MCVLIFLYFLASFFINSQRKITNALQLVHNTQACLIPFKKSLLIIFSPIKRDQILQF